MDYQDYITEDAERKKGQHLQREQGSRIQHHKGLAAQVCKLIFTVLVFNLHLQFANLKRAAKECKALPQPLYK